MRGSGVQQGNGHVQHVSGLSNLGSSLPGRVPGRAFSVLLSAREAEKLHVQKEAESLQH